MWYKIAPNGEIIAQRYRVIARKDGPLLGEEESILVVDQSNKQHRLVVLSRDIVEEEYRVEEATANVFWSGVLAHPQGGLELSSAIAPTIYPQLSESWQFSRMTSAAGWGVIFTIFYVLIEQVAFYQFRNSTNSLMSWGILHFVLLFFLVFTLGNQKGGPVFAALQVTSFAVALVGMIGFMMWAVLSTYTVF